MNRSLHDYLLLIEWRGICRRNMVLHNSETKPLVILYSTAVSFRWIDLTPCLMRQACSPKAYETRSGGRRIIGLRSRRKASGDNQSSPPSSRGGRRAHTLRSPGLGNTGPGIRFALFGAAS